MSSRSDPLLDLLYGEVARWRRRSFERHPGRRRRLSRPVISVGNLSVGGTGKTPVVAELAAWLLERGERPAILSRGYRRRDDVPGVVVVSDGRTICSGLDRSGDEPLMLARAVPGAIVCVCPDRFLAGILAERSLGATVHLLDDGFQHLGLARDLDVLVTTMGEIPGGRVLPRGRLREPMDAAARAHVLVVMGATAGAAATESWTLGVPFGCGAERTLGPPRAVQWLPETSPTDLLHDGATLECGSRVVVACGIANPERFTGDVRDAGYSVVKEVVFPDHHAFSRRDIAHLAGVAAESSAVAVLTTDKDAVRFEVAGPRPFVLYSVPLRLRFTPPEVLFDSVGAALEAHASRSSSVGGGLNTGSISGDRYDEGSPT